MSGVQVETLRKMELGHSRPSCNLCKVSLRSTYSSTYTGTDVGILRQVIPYLECIFKVDDERGNHSTNTLCLPDQVGPSYPALDLLGSCISRC